MMTMKMGQVAVTATATDIDNISLRMEALGTLSLSTNNLSRNLSNLNLGRHSRGWTCGLLPPTPKGILEEVGRL
jgi:hypothetical protein